LFFVLNHMFFCVSFSFHYALSETNFEDLIPYVCPCVSFTATITGRLSETSSYSHIASLVKNGKQIILYKKYNKVYSLWQLLCVVTETDSSS